LKWRYDAVRADGQKALVAGDVAGLRASITIQRELIAEMQTLIAEFRAKCRVKRLAKSG
jgi:hypothetical protein